MMSAWNHVSNFTMFIYPLFFLSVTYKLQVTAANSPGSKTRTVKDDQCLMVMLMAKFNATC
jgi:hypothetical protein